MDSRDKPSEVPGPVVEPSRRSFLTGVGTAALGAGLSSLPGSVAFAEAAPWPAGSAAFRFVYFPNAHLRDEFRSAEGLAAALQAAGCVARAALELRNDSRPIEPVEPIRLCAGGRGRDAAGPADG